MRVKLIDQLSQAVLLATGFLVATALTAPIFAQSMPNIAGNYRGLMTSCVAASQPNVCRAALTELARLADEVDIRRSEWEAAESRGDGATAGINHADYAVALDRLNRGITNFNRDVLGPRKSR